MPRIGVGVIVENKEGKILVGKREGKHAPFYSIPGGHFELGETFEEAGAREVKEETDLNIKDLKVLAVTNNLQTFKHEGKHTVSVILYTKNYSGELNNMEPNKCSEWLWVNPTELPQPHFEASELAVASLLSGQFCVDQD